MPTRGFVHGYLQGYMQKQAKTGDKGSQPAGAAKEERSEAPKKSKPSESIGKTAEKAS